MTEAIEKLKEIICETDNIVFFGGAGVSTESGIPDFRSTDGLYNQKYSLPPEEILSADYYYAHKKEFYDFYRDKMLYLEAKPNITHNFLSRLEKLGKLDCIITQNIDGLHQLAGSKKVIELHGSVLRNYCERCHRFYDVSKIVDTKGIPQCDCGGDIKPDVVLYQEGLDENNIDQAIHYLRNADLLIVGGTSLVVYPAAGLIRYFNGGNLVLVNKGATSYDDQADLVLRQSLGEVFTYLNENL